MTSRWNITRFDLWMNSVFDEVIRSELSLCLEIAPSRESDKGWAALERAHVYQITAVKDELGIQFRAQQDLVDRCPRLLAVSPAGAGHDTVDVEACIRAGIAVVSQLGGNAPSGAEMLLSLDDVVATFHTAGVSHEGRRNVATSAADPVLRLLRGERPPHLNDREVWDVLLERRAMALKRLQAA